MGKRRVERLEAIALKRKRWSESSALRWCRHYASAHYENFAVVSLFLPAEFRAAYRTLYAFARGADRRADDLFPEAQSEQRGKMRLVELALWRTELDRAFDGDEPPTHPAFVALKSITQKYGLEKQGFERMIESFERDQSTERFQRWEDVLEYTKGSANPVGRWLLKLHGEESEEKLKLSDDVCTGLQLVNFMQDIRSDLLERQRVYLPLNELAEQGVDEEMLAETPTPEPVRGLLRFQHRRASALLDKSERLIDRISDPRLRKQIRLFSGGGKLALESIERSSYDVNSEHRRVSGRAKFSLLMQTLAGDKAR